MNYEKQLRMDISTKKLVQKLRDGPAQNEAFFRAFNQTKDSYLKTTKKAIIMCGFFEDTHVCYHVELLNEHAQAVAFNIARPRGASFGATPRIGLVLPSQIVTIYCTYKSERISRVPDDGVHVYTIFQQEIPDALLAGPGTPKENERLARRMWSSFRDECSKCLRLGVAFEGKRVAVHEKHVEIIADMIPMVKSEKQEEMHSSQLPSANEDV